MLARFGWIALIVAVLVAVIATGCESPQKINVKGISCTKDEDCQQYNPSWLCDQLTGRCYQPFGENVFPQPQGDGDATEQEDCTFCMSNEDCPQGMICNLIVNCCIYGGTIDGDGEEDAEKQSRAYIEWDEELDFGSVLIGHQVCLPLRIRNTGLDTLEIYSITYDNVNQTSEFFLHNVPPGLLEGNVYQLIPMGTLEIEVCYLPVDMGIDEAELYIISNAYNAPIAKTILRSQYKGTAYLCAKIDPNYYDEDTGAIDFMNVDIGSEPAYSWVQLWNCGDATGNKVLFIYDISLTGYDYSFSIDAPPASDNNPLILEPKGELAPPCPPPIESLPSSCQRNSDCKPPETDAPGLPCENNKCQIECENDLDCQKGHPDWYCDTNEGVCKAPTDGCVIVGIHYAPFEIGMHGEHLQIFNSSDDVEQQLYTIDIMGSAENLTINARPNPIRCGGPCEYGDTCTTTTTIYNYSAQEVLIHKLDIVIPQSSDTPPWSFNVSPSTDYRDQPIPPSHTSGMQVDIEYTPEELRDDRDNPIPRDDLGLLRVRWCKTTNPDCYGCTQDESAQQCERRLSDVLASSYFPIMCSGKPPNVPPVARIALQSHGPPITAPIDLMCGDEIYLFGDISRDDDSFSTICAYCWHWRSKPAGSNPEIRGQSYYAPEEYADICHSQLGEDWYGWMNIHVSNLDKSGEYELELKVMDCDGAWSDNGDNWVLLRVMCEQGLGIILTYDDCDGKAQVDLIYRAPNGARCSEEDMNISTHVCNLRDYGAAIVAEYAVQCQDGTREEIIHDNPQDGTYTICAKLKEDCDHWGFNFFNEEICLDRAHPDVNIYLYDPRVGPGHWLCQASGHLSDQGDMECWSITREGGEWQCPLVHQ